MKFWLCMALLLHLMDDPGGAFLILLLVVIFA